MSTNFLRRQSRLALVATPVIAALIAAGCSSSPREADQVATTAPATSAVTESTVPVNPLDAKDGSVTTTVPAPTTTPAPAPGPAPAPSTTLGAPPVSLFVPVITLAPMLILPTVLTVSGATAPSCLDVALAGFTTPVSWTTSFAAGGVSVSYGSTTITGLPAAGTIDVPVGCGTKTIVTVTALWIDGSAGGTKSITIKVAAI